MGNNPTAIYMSLKPQDLCADTLILLWYARYHPKVDRRWTVSFIIMNLCGCIVFLVLAIKGIAMSYKTDLFAVTEYIQTCGLMVHLICKQLLFLTFNKKFIRSIEDKLCFWNPNEYNDEVATSCAKLLKKTKKFIRWFYVSSASACILFYLQPFFNGQLPAAAYVPDGYLYHISVIFIVTTLSMLFPTMAFEGFFLSSAIDLIVQFKMLGYRFETFTAGYKHKKAEICSFDTLVSYHYFLLKCCKNLNHMYNVMLLMQLIITIAASSTTIFILLSTQSFIKVVKSVLYFTIAMMEMVLYCVPAEYVANSMRSVGDCLYNSEWYHKASLQDKKKITLVLIQAQKNFNFYACGLIPINLQTFVVVCKTTFTFYTYLNSVKKYNLNI